MTCVRPSPTLLAALLLAGVALVAPAQGPTPRSLTLDEALGISDSVSDAVRIARASILRAEGQQEKATSQFLPQIFGSLSYQKTLASEYSGLGTASSTTPSCNTFTVDNTAPLDQRVTLLESALGCAPENPFKNLPFGQPNRYQMGLTLQQNLFTGGRLVATSNAAAAGRRSAGLSLTEAQAQLMLTVTQSYYDAALSDRLVGTRGRRWRRRRPRWRRRDWANRWARGRSSMCCGRR